MKKQTLLLLFIFLTLISGKITSQTFVPQTPNGLPLYQSGKLYLQVSLTSSVVINNRDTILNDPGGSIHTLFTKYHVTNTERPFAAFNTAVLNKTYRISFSQPTRIDSFILELSQVSSAIAYAEKVPAVYPSVTPNDAVYTATPSLLYHLPLLNMNQATNIYTSNPSNGTPVVAIVDDAVQITHQDLAANIYSLNANVSNTANITSNPNPLLAAGNASNFTHGTHVAGIAGAVTNNTLGVASIGWNSAKLMCVKASNDTVELVDPYAGITWAATHGAKVISMSWGSLVPAQAEYNTLLAAKNLDVVLVAAAGNMQANMPQYPAAYGEGVSGLPGDIFNKKFVVGVAALDQNNDIGSWPGGGSNFGSWIDIAAYGKNIYSTLAASDLSGNHIDNTYGFDNGTSMATPMVAAIAGMMRSYDMSKTADQIIDCLINTANADIYGVSHPYNQAGMLGSGRADAAAALRCVSTQCTVNPIVVIVPSSPVLCSSATLTLTANQGPVSYLWSTGATTSSITINSPGTYSVVGTYPSHCTASASITFSASPTVSLSLTTNTSICPGSTVSIISASGTYSALVWQPGALTGNSVAVNPTVSTVYSVSTNPSCGAAATINVNPTGTSSLLPNAAYSLLGSVLSGSYVSNAYYPPPFITTYGHFIITTDATVNIGATFYWADVFMAPNVKITVPASNTLIINQGRFHTCGTSMWQGIIVADGAQISTANVSIIEDAIAAISSTHTPMSSGGLSPASVQLTSTVFNKNYTDVSLTNYYDPISGPISYSASLRVDNCVFTCRDFLVPGTNFWPSAGFPNTGFGASTGIRGALSPTTGLSAPYLYTFSVTSLKTPYSGQTSRCAFFLSSSSPSNNIAGNDFVIGNDINPSYFNLFDNHAVFVDAQNTNVTLKNNVFQNQLQAIVPPLNVTTSSGTGQTGSGWNNNSAAVMHRTFNAALSTTLDMSASASTKGNRFWNCIRGVEGYNITQFKMSYGIARSTHTVDGQNINGLSGINLKANRVNYDINNCEFTNIKNAINVPLTAGFLTGYLIGGTPQYGNNVTALSIYSNTFSAGTPTNGNFMSQAVNVTNDLNVTPNSPSPLPELAPLLPNYGWINNINYPYNFHPTGLGIISNQINGAWNGVNVNGFTGFPVWITQNTLTLVENTVSAQCGIQLENGTSTAPGQENVWLNQVQGAGNSSADMSLIYCSQNAGNKSPLITCNDVENANKGFVFSGNNTGTLSVLGTQWLGNSMQNLANGMRLSGYVTTGGSTLEGIIGAQGDANVAMGNQWNGSTWAGTNYNIYTSVSSATNSPLSTLTATNSLNLFGNPPFQAYGSLTQPNAIVQTTHNDFFCNFTQYDVQPNPGTVRPTYSGTLQTYLVNAQTFHFLRNNSSLLSGNPDLNSWYSDMQSSSNLDALEQSQESLYTGDYSTARTKLNSLTAANYVEQNFIDFYKLYADYLQTAQGGNKYSSADSSSLAGMTQLCPIEYGSSIYKARGLYNTLYNIQVNYENCGTGGGGARHAAQMQNTVSSTTENRSVSIYPNPASSKIVINSSNEKDDLFIRIFDLTGRQVLSRQIKTENFIGSVDLDLINGAYMVTINNGKDQVLTTKLLIAK